MKYFDLIVEKMKVNSLWMYKQTNSQTVNKEKFMLSSETDDTPELLQCMQGKLPEQVQEVVWLTGSEVTCRSRPVALLLQSVKRADLWSGSVTGNRQSAWWEWRRCCSSLCSLLWVKKPSVNSSLTRLILEMFVWLLSVFKSFHLTASW